MGKIFWTDIEREKLAHECAVGLIEAKIPAVPSDEGRGNSGFLRPIIIEAQKRALTPERRRLDFAGIQVVTKRFWDAVPRHFKELQAEAKNGHDEAPPAPPPPPPPPDPAVILRECTDTQLLAEMGSRFLAALAIRQAVVVNIPGVDEMRASVSDVKSVAQGLSDTASRLVADVGELKTRVQTMHQDIAKLKPPPATVVCFGASHETQLFLRRKAEEGHLYVDFRFMDLSGNAKPFKADYVLTFASVDSAWDREIRLAVSKSHCAFIGGRHDAAIVQLRAWLGD